MLKNWKLWLGVLVVLCAAGYSGYQYIEKLKQDKTIAELALAEEKQLDADTRARLAVRTAEAELLGNMLKAANQLNGKLVAAVAIAVAKRDTTIVHDTLPTQTTSDSTRIASVNDSTFAGIIKGTITAPPFPNPLSFSYTLTRPEFRPSVGLVEVGDSSVWVVNWQGEEFKIAAPYARAKSRRLRPLGGFVRADYFPIEQDVDVQGGLRFTPFVGVDVLAGAGTRLYEHTKSDYNHDRLFVGAQYSF